MCSKTDGTKMKEEGTVASATIHSVPRTRLCVLESDAIHNLAQSLFSTYLYIEDSHIQILSYRGVKIEPYRQSRVELTLSRAAQRVNRNKQHLVRQAILPSTTFLMTIWVTWSAVRTSPAWYWESTFRALPLGNPARISPGTRNQNDETYLSYVGFTGAVNIVPIVPATAVGPFRGLYTEAEDTPPYEPPAKVLRGLAVRLAGTMATPQALHEPAAKATIRLRNPLYFYKTFLSV
ncbi:hypothetical protein EGW08_022072 [Elysia chlorotica]|uniref:Uncharacterized protein n=1 Tax=Elysia chlorotica TaxID=188477 RepID=A0A433SM21_ELYCH|nr:hypothetical protein EGW08_022072 [Elysia chlorotica]